ncbi:MAG: ABC transporter ATP-binding protein [Actinobacteria bacterium]|nr:ABC transporter ATP-binding protein [Actinomycetota bacterium]MBU4450409.1 ABC transporter ATP-binding protein [Actinomycetota bacterium]
MKEKILTIKNLSFAYDGSNVLDNINFDVASGCFLSILGPNGSGKSTLINLISKVLKNYKGEIIVKDRSLQNLNSKEIAKLVAVVPQYSNAGFNFLVGELVLMGRFPYVSRFGREKKQDFDIVEAVMEKTKTLPLYKRRFNELSGGEKQRVIIAQALVQDTPIILLDEPTSHLDINFQIEIMDLFYKLNTDEGKTIIGIFHDINLAANYSKKAILLKNGMVFGYGEINDTITKENIKKVFNSDIYVGKNPFTGKLYISPTFNPVFEAPADARDVKVHVIGGGGAASPIINLLYNRGYTVSCGVVNNFDTDLDTSEMLGISYVSEAPFSPISLYSQNKNLEFIKSSDIVVLPEIEFGHGNFSNLVSVKEAQERGKKVIIIEGKRIKDRDHTGGKAEKLYNKILKNSAMIIKDISEIFDKI